MTEQLPLPILSTLDISIERSRRTAGNSLNSRPPLQPMSDRLFVPLAADPFRWFESGGKQWELRRLGRQYTLDHVRPGRMVELRRGYADPDRALWGRIVDVLTAPSIAAFFEEVSWREVLPESRNLADALDVAREILGIDHDSETPVLGFRVSLEP